MTNLPTHQTGFAALSPQQQQEHRAKIGVRAKAILSGFWQDTDTHDAVQVIEIEGWMDVLENCSHSEIRDAWRDYQMDEQNRTARGRLMKPDAGALRRIILRKRPKPKLVKETEYRDPPCDRRVAQEICEQAGFAPKRFGEHAE